MGRRAVFLDRDGVINRKPDPHDYVKDFDEFHWNPGAKELIKKIKERGLLAVVVTNQQGIATNKMTSQFVTTLHEQINNELSKMGGSIDLFCVCPHHKDELCGCRKPNPGMFFDAAKLLLIDLNRSLMIGDTESDREAAIRAGCRDVILVKDNHLDVNVIVSEIDKVLS